MEDCHHARRNVGGNGFVSVYETNNDRGYTDLYLYIGDCRHAAARRGGNARLTVYITIFSKYTAAADKIGGQLCIVYMEKSQQRRSRSSISNQKYSPIPLTHHFTFLRHRHFLPALKYPQNRSQKSPAGSTNAAPRTRCAACKIFFPPWLTAADSMLHFIAMQHRGLHFHIFQWTATKTSPQLPLHPHAIFSSEFVLIFLRNLLGFYTRA